MITVDRHALSLVGLSLCQSIPATTTRPWVLGSFHQHANIKRAKSLDGVLNLLAATPEKRLWSPRQADIIMAGSKQTSASWSTGSDTK